MKRSEQAFSQSSNQSEMKKSGIQMPPSFTPLPGAPWLIYRLLSDVEASASAILEFIQSSHLPSDRHVWASISGYLEKLRYYSCRCTDLLKYKAVNEVERQRLKLWLEKAEYTAYLAEDILISFEFMLEGDQPGASAAIGQKRKVSELSLDFNIQHLTDFSHILERACSMFDELLIDHAGTFPFLRAVPQYSWPKVPEEQPVLGRMVEWRNLIELLVKGSTGCYSNTDISIEPAVGKGKAALTMSKRKRVIKTECVLESSGSIPDIDIKPAVGKGKAALTMSKERVKRVLKITDIDVKPVGDSITLSKRSSGIPDLDINPTVGTGKTAFTIWQSQSQDSSKRNVTPVCIIGASGVGKTVLARSLYNNYTVSEAFDVRLWVCMSENTDEASVLKEMIECITRQPCCIFELDVLQDILREELTGKKFLLVLDGAENANQGFWSSVLPFLELGAKGSFILVATRSREVAIATGSTNLFFLDPLCMKSSWLVFLQIFVRPIIGLNLRKMCKQLVARCGGIPLCIKMLSGVVCCLDNEAGIIAEVSHNELWEIDELAGGIFPAMKVCYDFLPIHLKHCLLYCSLFPKNFIFEKKHLVLLWVSQGFVSSTVGIEVEEVGSQYFDELLGRAYFEKSSFHNAKEDKYVIHELIHFLVQSLSRGEYFRSDDCLTSASATVKHFAIAHSEFKTDQEFGVIIKEVSDLNTFYVGNRSTSQWGSTHFRISHFMPLHELLMRFKNLRTLNLSGTDVEELPKSIEVLKNLWYLGLNATKIKALPLGITNLVNLRTLEAKQCSHLVELPKSITELSNLWHLDVKKEHGFVVMPSGIGDLTNLQTLSVINVGCGVSQCSIREMKNLENLRGSLQIAGLENVGFGVDVREANLRTKIFLQSVTLSWNRDKCHLKCNEGVAFEVLENLIPNNNLEELIIRNYPGIRFPFWVGDCKFSQLSSVIIDSCFKSIGFPTLGELSSLRYLSVRNMYGVKNLGLTKRFGRKTLSSFPSLELLNLREMHGLEKLFEIEERDFPCLHTLSISSCIMLKSVPCFPSLLELSIHSCTSMPEISSLPSLEVLKIERFHKTRSLNLPPSLPRLKKLEISHCNELVSVEGFSRLQSLENFKVIRCPNLEIGKEAEKQIIKNDATWTDNERQAVGIAGQLDEDQYNRWLAKARWRKALNAISFVTRLNRPQHFQYDYSLFHSEWLEDVKLSPCDSRLEQKRGLRTEFGHSSEQCSTVDEGEIGRLKLRLEKIRDLLKQADHDFTVSDLSVKLWLKDLRWGIALNVILFVTRLKRLMLETRSSHNFARQNNQDYDADEMYAYIPDEYWSMASYANTSPIRNELNNAWGCYRRRWKKAYNVLGFMYYLAKGLKSPRQKVLLH